MTQSTVNSYGVLVHSDSRSAFRVRINLDLVQPAARAYLYFYPDDQTLPDNRKRIVGSTPVYSIYHHFHQYQQTLSQLRYEKPVYFYFDDSSKYAAVRTGYEISGEQEPQILLDDWLADHAAIRNAIVWEASSGPESYSDWLAAQKAQLQDYFSRTLQGQYIALTDPPPNAVTTGDDDFARTVFREQHAWPLFMAHVAQSLAVEIGRWVPWSLLSFNSEELSLLLDSRRTFTWRSAYHGYEIVGSEHGWAIPAPPAYTHSFLVGNELIDLNRTKCIGRILDWCRQNLVHFQGGPETKNMENQWQYRGFPPVSRVLEGTPFTGHPEWGVSHRTAGCHGTSGLLRALLRVINVPTTLEIKAGHSLPHFVSEHKYLSHGDDPYNGMTRATPPYAAEKLLINENKFDAWFGDNVSEQTRSNNVGRRVRELAITYLPDRLLSHHCDDMESGATHAESRVYEYFQDNYGVAELEAMDLWSRLDAKIASFGGCEHIP